MSPSYSRYLVIAIIAALLFFPFLGQVHLFDWDEINFAECAREMIVTDNYLQVQINYMPFWEKPPLFIWMQVLAMKLFGVNEYAARFPNAFIGFVTLLTLFYVGKRVVNRKMAVWWVALYAASWLPHFYFKSGIIDPTFNYFIFLAFFQVYLIRLGNKKWLHAVLAGMFLGLAVLTKGPAAILIAILALVVYLIINRISRGNNKEAGSYKPVYLIVITITAFLTTCIWFGLEIAHNGWWMVNEFITYQVRLFQTEDAGHGGPFFYHFIILLLGCFPASVFLFHKPAVSDVKQKEFRRWMWILFWVVLILFSIVKTKIVHYSSMCYFPLTFLAAYNIWHMLEADKKPRALMKILLGFIGIILAIAITGLPLVGVYKDQFIPYINDPFAVANLQADVNWTLAEAGWGILYFIAIITSLILLGKNFRRSLVLLFVVQILIIQVTVIHFTPKIEAFSQRAAIEYFEELQGKDVYVKVLGYKSYAHLFYSRKQPQDNPKHDDEQWLLYGDIDKPAYFVTRITKADGFRQLPQLQEVGNKNGFVLFKRNIEEHK